MYIYRPTTKHSDTQLVNKTYLIHYVLGMKPSLSEVDDKVLTTLELFFRVTSDLEIPLCNIRSFNFLT